MDGAAGLWITPGTGASNCQHDPVSADGTWKIGGYIAEELLGYGASGQVWRGRAGRTGEAVALKVLHLRDDGAVRSARAEAALLSALDHPNLIRLRELLADADDAVLVLDLAPGGSLSDLLARRGLLTPGEVIGTLAPVAAALAYIHEQGVVHADVSPANILFTSTGVPLLADLGVARLLGDAEPAASTLAYLDPAVAAGGAAGAATDVFMIAAVAFHALTGRSPWSGTSSAELIEAAASAEIADLHRLLSAAPVAVADVVRRGLSGPPHSRGTAAEFALDLRHAGTPVPVELGAGRITDRSRASARHVPRHSVDDDNGGDDGHPGPGARGSARPGSGRPGSGQSGSGQFGSGQFGSGPPGSGPRPAGELASNHSGPDRRVPTRPRHDQPRLDRPEFSRPGPPGDDDPVEVQRVAALSLTHSIRAQIRPPAPPDRRWTFRRLVTRRGRTRPPGKSGSRRRAAAVVGATFLVVVVLATAGVAWARQTGAPRPSGSSAPAVADPARVSVGAPASTTPASTAPPTTVLPTTVLPTTVLPTTVLPTAVLPTAVPPTAAAPRAGPSANGSPPAPGDVRGWRQILVALDQRREQAFATRDPIALAAVYTSASLLSQDRATLRRTVPLGCRLTGLRTNYDAVRLGRASTASAVLRVTASLVSGKLRCPGEPALSTRAREPVTMTVRLSRRGADYGIAAQTVG